jgi:signal transduction histidine kinase
MDPEDIDGLFEAFEQASEGLSREYEGTGLGLSIVRRLVDLMNATIDVESREGEGSRFLVRWPPAEVSIGERPPETQSER